MHVRLYCSLFDDLMIYFIISDIQTTVYVQKSHDTVVVVTAIDTRLAFGLTFL
jgi:hypothetical protein